MIESNQSPTANTVQGAIDIERAIKWKFLVPTLFLRKPPSNKGIKACDLQPIFIRRLEQYAVGDIAGLISNYEADVMHANIVFTEKILETLNKKMRQE